MPTNLKPLSPSASQAPHLRDKGSVPGRMWTVVLALFPALAAFLFFSGFSAFRVTTIAVATAFLTEKGARRIFSATKHGGRAALYDGSAVVTALLFALLCPPALASWKVALGAAFAVFFGKEIFGGLGQNPFNPALVGIAFFLTSFPGPFETKPFLPALVLGGLVLMARRVIDWEVPLFYAGAFLIFPRPEGGGAEVLGLVFFAAFFLVTDPVTTPLTREGRRWFALAAGLLAAAFRFWNGPVESVTSSLLLMNALTPQLDRWLCPKGFRR